MKCNRRCEVFSRVVGYMRPVNDWNKGKKEEFEDRLEFDEVASNNSSITTRGYPKTPLEVAGKFNA